jgi:hypothetical protein
MPKPSSIKRWRFHAWGPAWSTSKSTDYDCASVAAGGPRAHVRTLPPAVVRARQPQADLVFKHMRRRIDLDVHGSPKSDALLCCLVSQFARHA